VQLGAAGSVTAIRAVITVGGSSYSQTLSIQPQDVSLIVEPIASAPPLYPGKPSIPIEGQVRLVAVASFADAKGVVANPSTYSYVWTIDGTEIADSSGIGKSSIIVSSPLQYRANDVSVAVTNPGTGATSGAALSLSPADPTVRIYENDPLLGIRFDHALSESYAINGAESTLFAAPFSLSTSGGAPLIRWFLNGTAVQNGNSVTLRPAGSGEGNASLSLTASGGETASVTADLSLIFGSTKSSNFLGL
jgi:hypothetical protein